MTTDDRRTATDALVLERTFDAPVDLVWQMWTEAEHFTAWYGPGGASVPFAEMDVREGGRRLVCMEVGPPDQRMQMWFTGEYLEVDPPHRLVYTDSMSDEHGNVQSPQDQGMPEGHPTTTRVIVELEDRDGRTGLTLTQTGIPQDSPAAEGWAMALDALDARLRQQAA